MEPSSLIFVAIVGVGAFYWVGHLIRRRDDVAVRRSMDRFSRTIQVLRRRPARRAGASHGERGHAASVSLTRSRVVVNRRSGDRPAHQNRLPVTRGPRRGSAAARRRIVARRIRGVLLLALMLAVPVVGFGAVLGWLPWPLLIALGMTAVVLVVSLRHAAVQDAERVRSQRWESRNNAETRAPQPDSGLDAQMDAIADQATGVFDHNALDGPADGRGEPWDPIPVPPPIYTLKAAAPPRAPAPTVDVRDEPAAAVFDLNEILARRIAAGG
ncbi:MAG: hypothetical protein ACRCTR_07050 [Actinomycetota bacterium]